MDNNQLENTRVFHQFMGIFWSENRVIFARNQGNFGNRVKFNFSVAALRRRNRRKKRRKIFGDGKYAFAEEKKTIEYQEYFYAV